MNRERRSTRSNGPRSTQRSVSHLLSFPRFMRPYSRRVLIPGYSFACAAGLRQIVNTHVTRFLLVFLTVSLVRPGTLNATPAEDLLEKVDGW